MRIAGGAAAAAQKHIDDRIDEIRIDREEPVIVELFGTKDRENGGERYRDNRRNGSR